MHFPIRDGIQEALKELKAQRYDMEDTVWYLDSFEYLLKGRMVQKMKEVRPPKNKEVVAEKAVCAPGGVCGEETAAEEAKILQ